STIHDLVTKFETTGDPIARVREDNISSIFYKYPAHQYIVILDLTTHRYLEFP
ncbi:hypothetical protein L9F63_014182, partial [Diploptera punctata]